MACCQSDLVFDKRTVVKTPNYYVQQMFSPNSGDVYLKNTVVRSSEEKLPTIEGCVGIGTWDTSIEVDKAEVNGKKFDLSPWRQISGNFEMRGDRYIQKDANAQPAISLATTEYDGDTVTYTVKARKTSGAEGFLLVFGARDPQTYYWWNVGGWGNSQHGIERTVNGNTSILTRRPGSIRVGKWYTMRVEMVPGRIRCFLDDELINDYEIDKPPISVASTLDRTTDEVILKIVNPAEEAIKSNIHLDGIDSIVSSAMVIVLAGEGSDLNSIDGPDNVKPWTKKIQVDDKFELTLPAMSVQFVRIKTATACPASMKTLAEEAI